jgi:hypothetical protein
MNERTIATERVLKYITVLLFLLVFDDGDERTLRRSQLCLKGEKHFIESAR